MASSASAISPDGLELIAGLGKTIRVYDIKSGRVLRELTKPAADVFGTYSVAFSPTGMHIAAGGLEQEVDIWSWPAGELVQRLEFSDVINDVEFSPDGRLIMAGSAGETGGFSVWNTESGSLIQAIDARIIDLAVASNDLVVSAADQYSRPTDTLLKLWTITDQLVEQELVQPTLALLPDQSISNVALSWDGRFLASVVGDRLSVITVEEQQQLSWPDTADLRDVYKVALSIRNQMAILEKSGHLTIVDVRTGHALAQYEATGSDFVVFTPDGLQVLIGGVSGQVKQDITLLEVP